MFESILVSVIIRLRVGVYLENVCVCMCIAPRSSTKIPCGNCNGKACVRVFIVCTYTDIVSIVHTLAMFSLNRIDIVLPSCIVAWLSLLNIFSFCAVLYCNELVLCQSRREKIQNIYHNSNNPD